MEPRLRGSLDSTSSTRGVRCGGALLLPRVWDNIGSWYPVQTVHPHFDVSFWGIVFGLGLFAFQSVLFGIFRTFFIIGGKKDVVCVAFLHVFGLPRNVLRANPTKSHGKNST